MASPRSAPPQSNGQSAEPERRADEPPAEAERRIERLFEHVNEPAEGRGDDLCHGNDLPQERAGALAPGGGLHAARVLSVGDGQAMIAWRGGIAATPVVVAPEVELGLLEEVVAQGGWVLVDAGPPPLVVGVLQTRRPRELTVRADTIGIEAEREILLRVGRAALRLRQDGDIEIVGSRIHAASRGLFRLVGRVLRLN